MSDPICQVRLPAHHPAVAKGGDYVHAKLKRVKDTNDDNMAMGGSVGKGGPPPPPPLEHRFNVMEIRPAGKTSEEESLEPTPPPAPKKKAKTPAELIRQRREIGK